MRIKNLIALFGVLFAILGANAQDKKYIVHTVAFYNLENLFDTINGTNNDEEWLPNGAQNWTPTKYKQKLHNLAKVLSEIGTAENPNNSPTLIGGCEIENRGVLEDLIKEPLLINKDYGIVHFDSPDKRGIDVALLYQKKHFTPTSFKNIPLLVYRNQLNTSVKEKNDNDDASDDDNNPNYINSLKAIQQLYSVEYENMRSISHPIIRNYSNIIRRANYIKPEIGLCIELHTHEQIVIIKTMWLKIIQRKWKKVFAERKRLLKERCLPAALYSRMMTGKWPSHCLVLPGLNGMLSNLL